MRPFLDVVAEFKSGRTLVCVDFADEYLWRRNKVFRVSRYGTEYIDRKRQEAWVLQAIAEGRLVLLADAPPRPRHDAGLWGKEMFAQVSRILEDARLKGMEEARDMLLGSPKETTL
jgi:hypothetical protein